MLKQFIINCRRLLKLKAVFVFENCIFALRQDHK